MDSMSKYITIYISDLDLPIYILTQENGKNRAKEEDYEFY